MIFKKDKESIKINWDSLMVINAKNMLTAVEGNEKWVTINNYRTKIFPYVPWLIFFIKIGHNKRMN